MLDEGKGLIHLDVSVTDANGEAVIGLQREDFDLVDEDHPQKILSFHGFDGESARPDPPVEIILFIDTFKMPIEQAAQVGLSITQFLRQNGGRLAQPVSIFGVSEDGLWTIAHHDSTDGDLLASDLAPNSRVVLNHRSDALRALGFVAAGERRKRGRKVLLWIGPGCGRGSGMFPASSNEGHKTFDQIYWVTTLLRLARLSIDELAVDQESPCAPGYQLYLTGPRTVREADSRFLYKKVLAIESGGDLENEGYDLVAAMNHCLRKARSYYTLSFDPPVALEPHEYHRLLVQVNKPGVHAQTTTGYYDEPFYSDQPNPAEQRMTVEQLGLILSEIGGRGTGDWEKELAHVELTERLSLANRASWTEELQAHNVPQNLVRIADASSFLAPPSAEIPKQPAPDGSTQQRMLALTRNYLEKSIPKLPDFYATRTTDFYEDTPYLNRDRTEVDYHPLQVVKTEKANVFFRAGDEVVEVKGGEPQARGDQFLVTHGTFGPILADLRRPLETPGRMKWVRWERGPDGTRAVFGYEMPAAESRDFEGGCCLPEADGEDSFRIHAGYHGEIAIDPAIGTILRLQLQFDLEEFVPQDVGEIQIDYGPVKIGGKTYFCPVNSVSISRARSVVSLTEWDESFLSYGPYSTEMNDMRFSNYHVFRSELRILPGFKPEK